MGACPSYKGAQNRLALEILCAQLLQAADWLDMQVADLQNDHLLDGLIAALTARAACLGMIHSIPHEDRRLSALEGWIALPTVPLASLVGRSAQESASNNT